MLALAIYLCNYSNKDFAKEILAILFLSIASCCFFVSILYNKNEIEELNQQSYPHIRGENFIAFFYLVLYFLLPRFF